MKSNPYIVHLYDSLPMNYACELFQRLKAGKTDPETRSMLRKALALSKQSRGLE